jgi:hypothetical protein
MSCSGIFPQGNQLAPLALNGGVFLAWPWLVARCLTNSVTPTDHEEDDSACALTIVIIALLALLIIASFWELWRAAMAPLSGG